MCYVLNFVVLFWVTAVLGTECDKLGILFYEDLGCISDQPKNSEKCPEKFKCMGLEPSTEKCFFKGKTYVDGEHADEALSIPSCSTGCFCNSVPDNAQFECAILDCPEVIGIPIPSDCYGNYTLNECCAVGRICPPFDNIGKCEFGGKTYREGDEFWPEDTCLHCACQKNTNGTVAPSCRRQSCGIQLNSDNQFVQKKCSPIYTSKKVHCCPTEYACADGNEKIEGSAVSNDLVCQFGDKMVKKGQFIETENITHLYSPTFKKVKCECVVPPLLKCHPV